MDEISLWNLIPRPVRIACEPYRTAAAVCWRVAVAMASKRDAYAVTRATKDDRSFIEIAALDAVAWRDAGGNYRMDEDHSDGGECPARLVPWSDRAWSVIITISSSRAPSHSRRSAAPVGDPPA
jgi:hypothetical protein